MSQKSSDSLPALATPSPEPCFYMDDPPRCTIHLLTAEARLPSRATRESVGFDVYAPRPISLPPRTVTKVSLDFSLVLPEGFYAQLVSRSSMCLKNLHTVGGLIDEVYVLSIYKSCQYNFLIGLCWDCISTAGK